MSSQTNINQLIFNQMSQNKYSTITPVEGQFYCVEDGLSAKVNQEILDRQSGDTTLQTNINTLQVQMDFITKCQCGWNVVTKTPNATIYDWMYSKFGVEIVRSYSSTPGCVWMLIFNHTSNNGANVFTPSNVMYNDNSALFSRLGWMEWFKYAGYYEMLLQFSDCEQHWKQSNNPIDSQSETVYNYVGLHIGSTANNWHGLAKSSAGETFLDGCNGSSWYYAVGAYSVFNSGIPGASSASQYAKLWVRIG